MCLFVIWRKTASVCTSREMIFVRGNDLPMFQNSLEKIVSRERMLRCSIIFELCFDAGKQESFEEVSKLCEIENNIERTRN